ncbi:MAG: ribosome biogenesis GTPase Der [Oligoflexia bacterium]|nr:ribosome biogenesis GTPase Der [Oligoflexia bacterium]
MKVAIIGRPNTGKSTLFNRLIGKNKAVTDDLPGVTRDRLIGTVTHYGKIFEIIDTGGYETGDDVILTHIMEQIRIAVEESDIILFTVDGKYGINALDSEIAGMLRKSGKIIMLVVNKIDNGKMDFSDFYSLGIEKVFPVSATHSIGISELLEEICGHVKEAGETGIADSGFIRLAIAGKPNTGKSTLLNSILDLNRAVTSDQPGTTRDVIEITLENDFGKYVIVDTAGIRRKPRVESRIEAYSIMRSKKMIESSDVALLVIDAGDGVTHQDKRVSELISESGTGCVIVCNKKDLVGGKVSDREIYNSMPYLEYAPVVSVSARFDRDFSGIFKVVNRIHEERLKKLSTGELNRFLKAVTDYKTPPMARGREVRLKYMVQVFNERGGTPGFIVFSNQPDAVHSSYHRYLIRRLREEYSFFGNPIELTFKRG